MGKIIVTTFVTGDRAQGTYSALFDSGASCSVLRRDVAEATCAHFTRLGQPRCFQGVSGREAFRCSSTCDLTLLLKNKPLDGRFYIVDHMPREIILGVDFLQKWEIILDPKRHDFRIGQGPESIESLF